MDNGIYEGVLRFLKRVKNNGSQMLTVNVQHKEPLEEIKCNTIILRKPKKHNFIIVFFCLTRPQNIILLTVLCNLMKAFYCVSKALLLKKLEHYGVRSPIQFNSLKNSL